MVKNKITYLGYNNLNSHKRGVENVIDFQTHASPSNINYYIHWDNKKTIYKYNKLICIGLKKDNFWIIRLNILLFKIKLRDKSIFLHSHNPLMSFFSLISTRIITVHDPLFYLMKEHKNNLFRIFWLIEKVLYLRCKRVHFISNFAKKMSLFPKNKSFDIIHNTSHLENFLRKENTKNVYSKENTNILIVRSIEERALIDLIFSVANKLKNEKYEFYIAGKGPLLEHYQQKLEEANLLNVKLLGYVADGDLISLYKNCDAVLVTAAYGEGFGLPIIEAYLFDKPVLASNVCAIPEIICSDEFLFENNEKELENKLREFKSINFNFKEYYFNKYSNVYVWTLIKKLYSIS